MKGRYKWPVSFDHRLAAKDQRGEWFWNPSTAQVEAVKEELK